MSKFIKVMVFTFLFTVSMALFPTNLSLSLDSGYAGTFSIPSLSSSWNWNTYYVSISERGSSSFSPSSGIPISMGIQNVSDNGMGVGISVSMLKENISSDSGYKFSWKWWDGTGSSENKNWEDSSSISIIPISLNIIKNFKFNRKTSLSVYGGATAFLAKIDLNTHLGYGVTLETNTSYYVDYYGLELNINESKTLFGGNVGANFEYRMSYSLGLYFGAQYFIVSKYSPNWKVNTGKYDGYLGSLYGTISDPNMLDDIMDTSQELNLSFFKIHFGVRIYL